MANKMGFLKACVEHLKLSNEDLAAFREQFRALTPQDRADIRSQMEREFSYTFEPEPSQQQ